MKKEYEHVTKDVTSLAEFIMTSDKNIEHMTVNEIMAEIYER